MEPLWGERQGDSRITGVPRNDTTGVGVYWNRRK